MTVRYDFILLLDAYSCAIRCEEDARHENRGVAGAVADTTQARVDLIDFIDKLLLGPDHALINPALPTTVPAQLPSTEHTAIREHNGR